LLEQLYTQPEELVYRSMTEIFLDTYEELNITKENIVHGDETRERIHEYYIKLIIKVSVDD
jgi:hypothetical protein